MGKETEIEDRSGTAWEAFARRHLFIAFKEGEKTPEGYQRNLALVIPTKYIDILTFSNILDNEAQKMTHRPVLRLGQNEKIVGPDGHDCKASANDVVTVMYVSTEEIRGAFKGNGRLAGLISQGQDTNPPPVYAIYMSQETSNNELKNVITEWNRNVKRRCSPMMIHWLLDKR